MNLSLWIFIIGVLGFVIHRNIIIILISIEIILLGATLNFLMNGLIFDDIQSQISGIIIITLAGAESAIGLALIVSYYRLRGTVQTETNVNSF